MDPPSAGKSNDASVPSNEEKIQKGLIKTTTQQRRKRKRKDEGAKKEAPQKRAEGEHSAESPAQVMDTELVTLALKQKKDSAIIEGKLIDSEKSYRRKRSLKFREKMRAWRTKVFKDPLYRVDRSIKNANKVIAAKRRKRDTFGKFNYEEEEEEEVKVEPKSRAVSLVDSLDLEGRPASGQLAELSKLISAVENKPN